MNTSLVFLSLQSFSLSSIWRSSFPTIRSNGSINQIFRFFSRPIPISSLNGISVILLVFFFFLIAESISLQFHRVLLLSRGIKEERRVAR